MFKQPFSFSGRIRRLEYGLTNLFCFIAIGLGTQLANIATVLDTFIFLIIITCYWILLAQGVKRCHDLGSNGLFQFIPLYILIMVFEDGEKQENKHGNPPKSGVFLEQKEPIESSTNQKSNHLIVLEIISTALLSVLILSINNIIFLEFDTFLILAYLLMSFFSFFIVLLISYNKKQLPNNNYYLRNQQLTFSFIYYVIIRLYTITFRSAEIHFETIFAELILVAFIFALTYISIGVYSRIFKAPIKNV